MTSDGYTHKNYRESGLNIFIVVHTESKFKNQVKEIQPVSNAQLDRLLELNILD